MKYFLSAALLACAACCVQAAVEIPAEIIGVWASPDAEFNGQALKKGRAIYLDVDSNGATIAGDGQNVMGAKLVATGYNPQTNTLSFDMVESRNIIMSAAMKYDPVKKTLYSQKDPADKYQRRFEEVQPEMRKTLGLEARSK
ncbi:hypothetical protein ACO0LO_18860 [Undibacterium sp. TJN25]|uniref:hypothetical protein n=1 Tax=Undibacterium sp. TJN25 TaxID=3413056 RepID=UPI003BF37F3C